jgi:gamma-glutamylcyclotransferase (GGCT)/AIG2-like uncharacterized protein YtfP
MLQNLFVYGTLMSTIGHRMALRLAREGRLIGPAAVRGRLYDLGAYPALVEADAEGGEVYGEVHALTDPAASFRWLDAYEGIVPGRDCEYVRVQRSVRLETGAELTAWLYLYRAPVVGRRLIKCGRWTSRFASAGGVR